MPSIAAQQVTESTFPDEPTLIPEDAIQAIVRDCDQLPEFVRHASFTQVNDRRLDATVFNTIVSQPPSPANKDGWPERLQRRRTRLLPFVDTVLTCIFIRLPGVHYTIEVDPVAGEVVYWEWEAD